MNIIVLGGFLGSGKTTFLLNLISNATNVTGKLPSLAILENEIGSVGIDDQLIRQNGYTVKTMLAGCACCTMAGELPEAVLGIERDIAPHTLIIEATGLAVPSQIKENLQRMLGMQALTCTLVDASRWKRIQQALPNLADTQLQDSDLIVITKSDLVEKDELDYVLTNIEDRKMPAKVFVVSANDKIPLELLNTLLIAEN